MTRQLPHETDTLIVGKAQQALFALSDNVDFH
jgi:hypothetical protein